MNRRLSCLNLLGVLVLAILCVVQWRHDRSLNLALNQSGQTCLQQAATLTDQTNQLNGLNGDLARFKASLADEQKQFSEAETKLHETSLTNELLAAERDQLKVSITNWTGAVAARDQLIHEANGRIEQLSTDLNATINKYNAQVTNYNTLVNDYNALRASSATNAVGQ